MKWPWVVHHSSATPSSETLPTAAWGSMYPWCTGAVLNSRSTITSAFLKPASMSPSVISTRLATLGGLSGLGSTPAVKRWSCRRGAPGGMASTTSITCGSTSYVTSVAFSARWGVGRHGVDGLAGRVELGRAGGGARALVDGVRPDRARADVLGMPVRRLGHRSPFLIVAAASSTALTILSYPVHRQRLPASQ